MSGLSKACPYHSKRWRGHLQCLVNKLRGNILPSELTKRVSIVLCCCKGKGVTCQLDKLPELTKWLSGQTSTSLKAPDDLKVFLQAASNENVPVEDRRALLNVVQLVQELLHGNVERLIPADTVVPDPVDTKAIEVALEDARLGRVIGKNGVHIKALCKAYNVTAKVTRATTADEPGRRKMIYDQNVLVLVSAPMGHDQDVLKFEKAFVEHVDIVKKAEKKHKEQVEAYRTKLREIYKTRAMKGPPQHLSNSVFNSEKEAATAHYEKKQSTKSDAKTKPSPTLANSRCLLCLAPYQPNETQDGACRYHSGFITQTKRSHRWNCCKRRCKEQHPSHDLHATTGCCRGRHMWRPTRSSGGTRKARKSNSSDILDDY